MTKVITYGTYDLLHYGHIKLLERAKALGDYLIVGVTADDFDRTRGKINVQQSLMERVDAVRRTGLADEIIVEEYEGQKIDDIKRFGVDIFTVGSDWVGVFDYLKEYCEVVYLDRTQGVSSTELRSRKNSLRIGIVGESPIMLKFIRESRHVNGVSVNSVCTQNDSITEELSEYVSQITQDYDTLLKDVDAVYIVSHPSEHAEHISRALNNGKHVLCESPLALCPKEVMELFNLAKERGLVLNEAIKTAYSTAYGRLILMAKGGKIGEIVSVDSVCTSLKNVDYTDPRQLKIEWSSMTGWGPVAMLPIFQLLGDGYVDFNIYSRMGNKDTSYDEFTKVTFQYPSSVASIKIGKGVKSEGELIISGTKGYIYVPAPWWKTDYFEVRFENVENNRRYFYQLEGEGIRNEIVAFTRQIEKNGIPAINESTSIAISRIMEAFHCNKRIIPLEKSSKNFSGD